MNQQWAINDSITNQELLLSLSHSLKSNFSWVKPIVFIPLQEFEYFYLNQIPFNFLCKHLNEFSTNLFAKLEDFFPADENEKFLKFICVQKKEKKFIEVIKRKILFITNKKIIEMDEENDQLENSNIFPIAKFEMINVFPDKNSVEIVHSNGKIIEYSSLSYLSICKLIKDIYNEDCLIPLPIKKKI